LASLAGHVLVCRAGDAQNYLDLYVFGGVLMDDGMIMTADTTGSEMLYQFSIANSTATTGSWSIVQDQGIRPKGEVSWLCGFIVRRTHLITWMINDLNTNYR